MSRGSKAAPDDVASSTILCRLDDVFMLVCIVIMPYVVLYVLSQKNLEVHLKFAEDYLDTPQCHWEKDLWTEENKVELFAALSVMQEVYHKPT